MTTDNIMGVWFDPEADKIKATVQYSDKRLETNDYMSEARTTRAAEIRRQGEEILFELGKLEPLARAMRILELMQKEIDRREAVAQYYWEDKNRERFEEANDRTERMRDDYDNFKDVCCQVFGRSAFLRHLYPNS